MDEVNMNLSTVFSTIALCVVATGCGAPRSDFYLDGIERPAKPSDAPIDIWYSGQEVPRPYKPIILLRITGDNGPEYIARLRKQCRKYGADAAVFQNVRGHESSGNGFAVSSGVGGSAFSGKDVIEALGVIYTDTPAPTAP